VVRDGAARTRDLSRRFATGLLEAETRRAAEVVAEVPGAPALDLGDVVSIGLSDSGAPLSGYVRSLRHTWDGATGFRTRLVVRLEQRP
jgi:hypothetical protein